MDGGTARDRKATGIDGLDEVLAGGLLSNRAYVFRGPPGSGKTLAGLHFLVRGVETGDTSLFVSFEESEAQIRADAGAVGLDVDDVAFLDLTPESDFFVEEQAYDIFAPDETEQSTLNQELTTRITAVDPDRVVLDPVTQLRYLSPDDFQFRKQILSLLDFLKGQGTTVLFTSQDARDRPDDDLQFLGDGVVEFEVTDDHRTVRVPKFRGSTYEPGRHGMEIGKGGIAVYPELRPGKHEREFAADPVSSGVPAIDELLNGGIERGTVTIVSGPTGVGKTSLGTQFAKEAASRGERSIVYLFEESPATFRERSRGIAVPVDRMEERGTLSVRPVEPLRQSAQSFAWDVRDQVEGSGADVVLIDGVDGYRLSIRGERADLTQKLHSLCRYLKNVGVTVVLIDEVQTVTGEFRATSESISYLADNIVFLRYLELRGELRKAIGVLKKRTSDYERTLREFQITPDGIEVGAPLSRLRGVLRGDPEWIAQEADDDREGSPPGTTRN